MRAEEREGRRGRGSVWPALGVAFGVLALVYLAGWGITGGRYSRALARLKARGEAVEPSDLAAKLKPGERNAAEVYEQAFPLTPAQTIADLYPLWDTRSLPLAQKCSRAQAMIASNQQYFDLLEEASRIEQCAFEVDWDNDQYCGTGNGVGVDQFGLMYQAMQAVSVRSGLRAYNGDLDGALDSYATLLRVADHSAQMPWSAGYRIAARVDRVARDDILRVLDEGDPSPSACRRLFDQLGQQDHHASWIRSLEADRATGILQIRWLEGGGLFQEYRPRRPLAVGQAAYPVVAKPLWNADKGRYLELMAAYLEAAQRPWPEAVEAAWRLDEQAKAVPDKPTDAFYGSAGYYLFKRLGPRFWYAGREAATAGALQVALALKAYHHEHGSYPATLAELERSGWKLPRDPFSQRSYRYRRDSSGFTVWSMGPDGKDDAGRAFSGPPVGRPKPGYDFVVRCGQ